MRAEILPGPTPGTLVVRFTNDGDTPAWLARPRDVLGRAPEHGFLQLDPAGAYRGRLVKRRPYTAAELLRLTPGETVTSPVVRLADHYTLPPADRVRVRYDSAHPLAGAGSGGGPFIPVVSGWVTVGL